MQYDENAEKYGYEGEMTPLKCDKLTAYKGDVTIPVYGTIADADVYLKKEADEAIAELKAKLQNQQGSRKYNDWRCEMKCDKLMQVENPIEWGSYYDKDEADEAIAELKEFAEDACIERDDNQTAIDELQAENAELKQKLDRAIAERDGNQVCIDALKKKLENVQASMYADVVDANMENRRLKRALYKACANWADVVAFEETEGIGHDNSVAERWRKMERKCLKKAKEYK